MTQSCAVRWQLQSHSQTEDQAFPAQTAEPKNHQALLHLKHSHIDETGIMNALMLCKTLYVNVASARKNVPLRGHELIRSSKRSFP